MTPEDQLKRYATVRDEQAFAQVVSHFSALVYGLALRRCRDGEMAAEIAQDVFLTCARKATALSRSGTLLGPWLHRTTLLETMNYLRKADRHRLRLEAFHRQFSAPVNPLPAALESDDCHVMHEELDRLPAMDRQALLLRFYNGHSFPEMGKAMGCTGEAARKICSRAVGKLEQQLLKKGVVPPAMGVAAALFLQWSSAKASVPAGLSASLSEGVFRQVALMSAGVTNPVLPILTMKLSSTSLLVILFALPIGWFWLIRPAGEEVEQSSAREIHNSVSGVNLPMHSDNLYAGGRSGQPPLPDKAIHDVVNRLLKLRPKVGTEGEFDTASLLEREQIRSKMITWPARSVRAVLDLLLSGNEQGRQSLLVAEWVLEKVYSTRAPAEASKLGMVLLERDPFFRGATLWSTAEWFRSNPVAAREWLAQQEAAGTLESAGIEDIRRQVAAEAGILGLVMADPAGARDLVRKSSPDRAFSALSALIAQGEERNVAFDLRNLALAISDPNLSGRLLGLQAKSGTQPMWEAETTGARLALAIPAYLTPEVRQAALVEGSLQGGARESLATLLHATSAQERPSHLQVMATRLVQAGPVDPAILADPLLTPWRDAIAAAMADAWESAGPAGESHRRQWAMQVQDPSVRAALEQSITRNFAE